LQTILAGLPDIWKVLSTPPHQNSADDLSLLGMIPTVRRARLVFSSPFAYVFFPRPEFAAPGAGPPRGPGSGGLPGPELRGLQAAPGDAGLRVCRGGEVVGLSSVSSFQLDFFRPE